MQFVGWRDGRDVFEFFTEPRYAYQPTDSNEYAALRFPILNWTSIVRSATLTPDLSATGLAAQSDVATERICRFLN